MTELSPIRTVFGPGCGFHYHVPTSIEAGPGSMTRLPAVLQRLDAGQRVLLVGDPGVARAGLIDRVKMVLLAASIPVSVFTDIESDPDVRSIDAGTAFGKAQKVSAVVGVGGGSALDTAKAIGLMLTNAGDIRDFVGIDKVPESGAPVVALPTTAGTGSEVTIWSVLSDKTTGRKISVGSVLNCPRVAILDPELSLTLPPSVTAATGMDALTHAIESYVCKAAQPISEALAERAIAMIGKYLPVAVRNGSDLAAREGMLVASTLAGMAFNNTRLGLVHAFAMPLGATFGIPHGLVNAIMLPSVMRYNLSENVQKFARIAELLGAPVRDLPVESAARCAVDAVESLRKTIGITERLGQFGVGEGHFDEVVAEAMLSGNVLVNPRQPSEADMRALLAAELE